MTYERRPGRKVERRGDLSGLAFLVFGAALLVALAAVAFLFLSLPPRDEPGVGAGSPTPRSASPSPIGTAGLPTTSPSPVASLTPTAPPITLPPSSEAPTPTASPLVPVAIGQPAAIVIDGAQAGTVTILGTGLYTRLEGVDAPPDRRWLGVEVRYEATPGPLPYATVDWRVVTTRGRVIEPTIIEIPSALGSGTLEPGATRQGFVVFDVRPTVPVERLELLGPDGAPMLAFTIT